MNEVSSIIDPAVLLDPNIANPTDLSATAMKGRLVTPPVSAEMSAVSKIAGLTVRGHDVVLTLAEDPETERAGDPRNYLVMINGATFLLAEGDVDFNPSNRTVTFRHLPMRAGDRVGVTVIGLWDRLPFIPNPSITCETRVPRGRSFLAAVAISLLILIMLAAVVYRLIR